MNRVFSYVLPADNSVFAIPDEAQAQLSASLQRCLERKDVEWRVYVLMPNGRERLIDAAALIAEC